MRGDSGVMRGDGGARGADVGAIRGGLRGNVRDSSTRYLDHPDERLSPNAGSGLVTNEATILRGACGGGRGGESGGGGSGGGEGSGDGSGSGGGGEMVPRTKMTRFAIEDVEDSPDQYFQS